MQPDYVDYMIGHAVNTYHDIQSLGIETLRNAYTAANLTIAPKTQTSQIDALKQMIKV